MSSLGLAVPLFVLLTLVPCARAQPFTPHIGYVYPAGGRQGTTFQVVVGGQYLGTITNAFVSGTGVRVALVEYNRPMSPKEFNELREKLKELQQKRKTTEVLKELAEIRARILKNPPNRQGNPAIAETVTIEVTMAPEADPGEREIRLQTAAGLSNPLLFCVGQLPEFSKAPGKAPNPDAERFKERLGRPTAPATTNREIRITLPAVVNGQILPGVVDRYRFTARKGQHLVMAVSARALIPYLPDAVPGWFQATLALYDAKGQELAYDDSFRFNPDPVLHYEAPADGEYSIAIKDSLYRGREDFVYRVTIGELPFITSIFPLGGRLGASTTAELKGWNLSRASLTLDGKDKALGVYRVSVGGATRSSNLVPFRWDALPECLEQEPNNELAGAQRVSLPIIVNGRIDRVGDMDLFSFEGHAGSEIVAEVQARRLNSPLDSMLKLTDAAGRQLAFNDDHEDRGSGLTTHHADSYLRATLPTNGTFHIHLSDAQQKGGPEYGYRLRISSPQPDFQLRVVPSSINVRGGGTVPVTVYALRQDGFSNDIALVLKDPPPGFKLSGARVPAGQDQVRFTVTAPPGPTKEPIALELEGRAMIEGRPVNHPAVPAEDMMQAFAYRHLVPAQELKVAVSGRWMQRAGARIPSQTPVRIPAGGLARIAIGPTGPAFADRVRLELSEPPEGVSIKEITPSGGSTEILLQCDAAKARPGMKGNLIVNAFAVNPNPTASKVPAANRRPMPIGSLPAIPFEIVAR